MRPASGSHRAWPVRAPSSPHQFVNAPAHPGPGSASASPAEQRCGGTKDLRIEPGIASHLLGIHLVALTIAVRDCPQLAHVGHHDFMAEFPNLFTNPDGMRPSFHGDTHGFQIAETLVNAGWVGSKTATIYDLAVLAECAVMAPDVPKVNSDRHADHGTSALTL